MGVLTSRAGPQPTCIPMSDTDGGYRQMWRSFRSGGVLLRYLTPQPTEHGPLYLMYVWVRVYCAVAHRDYSSLHACKEEEEERCLFLEREW